MVMLNWSFCKKSFPTDTECRPECLDGELTLSLIGRPHPPVVDIQRRLSPEESQMIFKDIHELLERGMTRA